VSLLNSFAYYEREPVKNSEFKPIGEKPLTDRETKAIFANHQHVLQNVVVWIAQKNRQRPYSLIWGVVVTLAVIYLGVTR
jgi:hypothetical protein